MLIWTVRTVSYLICLVSAKIRRTRLNNSFMVGPCTTAMTSQAMHVMSVDRGNEVQLKNTVVQRIFPHDIL